MFNRLFHADWSLNPRKRWSASASRHGSGWRITAPHLVGKSHDYLDHAFRSARTERVLLGFDFPIGLPNAYGDITGFRDFREALPRFGFDDWAQFFDVARLQTDISVHRPFYPNNSTKGVQRQHLTTALGIPAFADLLRLCERTNANGPLACALFWTLGGNQVGKAAITGWQEIVRPALDNGALLWPFDGDLSELAYRPRLALAETYPAEAYRMIGASFSRLESKRRQSDRASKASAIHQWATRNEIEFSDELSKAIDEGFGARSSGEDAFDAFAGLTKMIEVVDRRRPEASVDLSSSLRWEGWILGR